MATPCHSKEKLMTDAVKEAIQNYGPGIIKLAEESGVNKSQIYRFLNGKCSMNANALEKLFIVLGLEVCPKKPTSRARRGK